MKLKSLIPELNSGTTINAIKLMLKKGQRNRAYQLLKQLTNGISIKARPNKVGGVDLVLHGYYGLTQNDLRIEFAYDKGDGLGITTHFNYNMEVDDFDEEHIKLYSRQDAVFVVNAIKKINPNADVKVQDFLVKQYEQVTEQSQLPSPIDGMNKKKAINFITKNFKVYEKLRGFFSDESWRPINELIGEFQKGGIPFEINNTEYYKDNNGNPAGKIWQCEIPFTNQNNRPDKLHVRITAAGAGSVQDPLQRYDVTFVIS